MNKEQLLDVIHDCIAEEMCDWGTTAKVDYYGEEKNISLRVVLNRIAICLSDTIDKEINKIWDSNQ